jgi:hypothetical protein
LKRYNRLAGTISGGPAIPGIRYAAGHGQTMTSRINLFAIALTIVAFSAVIGFAILAAQSWCDAGPIIDMRL